jgi:hypothetical protein
MNWPNSPRSEITKSSTPDTPLPFRDHLQGERGVTVAWHIDLNRADVADNGLRQGPPQGGNGCRTPRVLRPNGCSHTRVDDSYPPKHRL